MKKHIPLITAVPVTVLWIVLWGMTGRSVEGLSSGFAGIAALLLFAAAWNRGKNPDVPFWQVIVLSLAGMISPVIAELNCIGTKDISEIGKLLLCSVLVILMYIIGKSVCKRSGTSNYIILLFTVTVVYFLATRIFSKVYDALIERFSFIETIQFYGMIVVTIAALTALLAAYAETITDSQERRSLLNKSWWLLIIIEIIFAVTAFSPEYFDNFSYVVFNALLQLTLPLIFWNWDKWLQGKINSVPVCSLLYFIGAFIINYLQSGGLGRIMDVNYSELSPEWMIIGTITALIIYWQKPVTNKVTGIISNVVFAAANAVLLFADNIRVRMIIYNISGLAVDVPLYRDDWWGYRLNTIKAFVSGDFSSLYDIYGDNWTLGFTWVSDPDKLSVPLAFPITIAILVLCVVIAILMMKFAKNHKAAKLMAIGIIIQSIAFAAEEISMVVNGVGLPFAGAYLAEYVLVWLVLHSESAVSKKSTMVKDEDKDEK